MKQYLPLLIGLSLIAGAHAKPNDVAASNTTSFVSNIVSSGDELLNRVDKAIKAQEENYLGDTINVSDKDELLKHLDLKILKAEKDKDNYYQVTLGLYNKENKTVKLTGLKDQQSVLLLDNEKFVYYRDGNNADNFADITIPELAAVRVRYTFSHVEERPTQLRLYGHSLHVYDIVNSAK